MFETFDLGLSALESLAMASSLVALGSIALLLPSGLEANSSNWKSGANLFKSLNAILLRLSNTLIACFHLVDSSYPGFNF